MIAAQEQALCALLERIGTASGKPRHIGKLVAHDAGLLEVTGFPYPVGHGATIRTPGSGSVRAEVVGFRGSRTMLAAIAGDGCLQHGARVEPSQHANCAAVGDTLLGRVVGPLGEPLDGLGPVLACESWPLAGKHGNVLDRDRVAQPIDLGVRAINALLTAGAGQRIAVVAGSGVGKSVLINQIIAHAAVDVTVVGLIGERGREVSDFVHNQLQGPARGRTVTIAVPADHSPILRLRAAMRATAIAEYFRSRGQRVLLVIDSLTRIAHAQREIGLATGEPPTMKGYPPSALALIPQFIERAGNDRPTGGSITALYTVLADGGDLDDPVVDSARAIVDGHIVLSRQLAEQGVFPAIDIGRSLSRVASDIVSDTQRAAQARFRQLWSAYESVRDLLMMGAYRPGSDPLVDEAVRRHAEQLNFIRQARGAFVSYAASVTALEDGFAP